jgi:hypothetical protein
LDFTLPFWILLFHACDGYFKNSLKIVMDKNAFDKEYLAWENQNIKNHQFVYKYFSDAGPVKVTVRENEPPVVENLNSHGNGNTYDSTPDIYNRVKSTFEFIESVKNDTYDGHKINSLTLNITHDDQYHYPKKVNFSESYEETIDGGGVLHVRNHGFCRVG